ncbi:unnamed protein product [Trifolium pratense]|uniref:Uncharacterized protein n=1 Tax=Trifolium pratense TaxID=57577 RepID=A0ACB0LT13_TRIPR|nr:unnamed protein product [Trifolium pratense]
MNFSRQAFLLLFFILVLSHVKSVDCPFEQNYISLWGQQNMRILDQRWEVQLTLDQNSGSGFQSVQSYGFGWFSMRIKLPKKDSTAVITTFYLISDTGTTRDEIDFEFLGGNLNQPPILHTNIYINGQDFHDYTLLLNEKHIVFFVDGTPIRVFKNSKDKGGSYRTQAMKVYATIWTNPWGSNGVPINWNDAPFEAHYRSFGINACQAQSTNLQPCNYSSKYWWNAQKFLELNPLQKQAYNNVRNIYLFYNYCTKQTTTKS